MAPNADIQVGDVLVTSGIDGTYPPGLAVARVATLERDTGQMFARITCTPLAGVDRSEHLLVLGPGRGAAAAARGAAPTPTPRRKRGKGKRAGADRDGAARTSRSSRPPAPEEILRPVRPWFIVLTLAARARRATCCRCRASRSRCGPTSSRWCCSTGASRSRATSASASPGASACVMDVGDATLFGQHALAYAVLAYAAEYFRRRVLRFPLWQQAAQVAVLLRLVRGARAAGPRSSAARRCRAGRTRCRRSSARSCGRCCHGRCCSGRSGRSARRPSCDGADRADRRWRASSSPRAARYDGGALRLARAAATRSARLFLFRRRLAIAGALVVARVRRRCSRASSTCRSSSTTTTRRSPRRTASRSCRSCPTAA